MASRAKKTDEGTQIVSADTQIDYVSPLPELTFVYANNALMTLSELDGSIIFGEVVGKNEESGKTLVVPKVKVVMATPFIRRLQDLLAVNIANLDSRRSDD